MNGDEMASQILHQSCQIMNKAMLHERNKKDFDDISSIYDQAKVTNDDLGKTMRRIKNRDELLSNFNEDIGEINRELDFYNRIEETAPENEVSQYIPTQDAKDERENKEDQIIEKYYSATQKTKETLQTQGMDKQIGSNRSPKKEQKSLEDQLRDDSEEGAIDLNQAHTDIKVSNRVVDLSDDSQNSKKI